MLNQTCENKPNPQVESKVMIDPKLLSMLRCPASGGELELVEQALVDRVNRAIAEGQMRDAAGQVVSQPIDAGLVTADRDRLYPIRNEITTMIVDQAFDLSVLDAGNE